MPRLLSVNLGLPREVTWQGKIVRTAIWKRSVSERVFARRLNLEGDGQADLKGHGGENRAVMVYQIGAYRYGSANLVEMTLGTGSLEKLSPLTVSLTMRSASGIDTGSAVLFLKWRNPRSPAIGSEFE